MCACMYMHICVCIERLRGCCVYVRMYRNGIYVCICVHVQRDRKLVENIFIHTYVITHIHTYIPPASIQSDSDERALIYTHIHIHTRTYLQQASSQTMTSAHLGNPSLRRTLLQETYMFPWSSTYVNPWR
jgi:hypothetical protein